jgi:nitroimidazol reductase NimA-like FMN-containing flavoprotein (pyridoxamine 5'-phosphate oxidase superfamily)
MAEEKQSRPVWWTRQYLEPFALTDEEAWQLIDSPPWYCVIAWVTKNCEPVACAAAYVVIDGKVMLSSTANRDKVKALRRNPAVSLCFEGKGMKQVTARGKVEISNDPELVRRWAVEHMATFERPMTEDERSLSLQRYISPDRVVLIAHIDRLRSFDGGKMFRAEKQEQQS